MLHAKREKNKLMNKLSHHRNKTFYRWAGGIIHESHILRKKAAPFPKIINSFSEVKQRLCSDETNTENSLNQTIITAPSMRQYKFQQQKIFNKTQLM